MSRRDFDGAAKPARRDPPYSIRFNARERAELDRLSGSLPWATYTKGVVFGRTVKSALDHKILAKLLAALGKSRLAANINQLARAANSGSLPINEDVPKALMGAAHSIEWMKITLIEGMGLKAQRKPSEDENGHDHGR